MIDRSNIVVLEPTANNNKSHGSGHRTMLYRKWLYLVSTQRDLNPNEKLVAFMFCRTEASIAFGESNGDGSKLAADPNVYALAYLCSLTPTEVHVAIDSLQSKGWLDAGEEYEDQHYYLTHPKQTTR